MTVVEMCTAINDGVETAHQAAKIVGDKAISCNLPPDVAVIDGDAVESFERSANRLLEWAGDLREFGVFVPEGESTESLT